MDKWDDQMAAGSPYRIEWDGVEYRFDELNGLNRGEFSAALKAHAVAQTYETVKRYRTDDGKPDVQRIQAAFATLEGNINALQYDWGGQLSMLAIQSMGGGALLLSVLNKAAGGKAEPEEIELLIQAKQGEIEKAGLGDVVKNEVMALLSRIIEDSAPKSRAAAMEKINRDRAARAAKLAAANR